jgi:hypothetical protein
MEDLLFRYELREHQDEHLEVLISSLLHTTPSPGIVATVMELVKIHEGSKPIWIRLQNDD